MTTITRRSIFTALGVHPHTAHLWCQHPTFPAPTKQVGRTLHYPAVEVCRWLVSHGRATPAQVEALRALEVSHA